MDIFTDPRERVKEAHLRYVSDTKTKGITRVKKRAGFTFLDTDGKSVSKADRARIKNLVIPPAWQNVWISPFENSHLQATGYDEKGRKQYIYHADWNNYCQENKFNKMVSFGHMLPIIRRFVRRHMHRYKRGLDKKRVLAALVWLLENTFIRIGNREYVRENDSFGLTTLRVRHIQVRADEAILRFKGKSGVAHEIRVDHPQVVKTIKKCVELPGFELFQYVDTSGEKRTIDSSDVNDYLNEITGTHVTAKDFRTWGGTLLAAQTLYDIGPASTKTQLKKNISHAVKEVAAHLRNTTTVCRSYYIHPAVIAAYEKNELSSHFSKTLNNTPKSAYLKKHEKALITLLKKYTS